MPRDSEVAERPDPAPQPTASFSSIETHGLTKRFGSFVALDHADLAVRSGEMFGLIGSNGAGKSTLVKMLTTLMPISAGSALVAGYDVGTQPVEVRRRIGYVPQLLSADGALTGYENMYLSSQLYRIPRRERKQRIEEALSVLGLTEHAGRLAQEYSGGMLRRLEIAQSMLHRPAVLFMDEPTVGLDPGARQAVWDHVLQLQSTLGTTMLMTTHYMQEAEAYCDRIAVLHAGRIVAIGTPSELKARIGSEATLDDVFAKLAGAPPEIEEGGYGDVRRTRLGIHEHG